MTKKIKEHNILYVFYICKYIAIDIGKMTAKNNDKPSALQDG